MPHHFGPIVSHGLSPPGVNASPFWANCIPWALWLSPPGVNNSPVVSPWFCPSCVNNSPFWASCIRWLCPPGTDHSSFWARYIPYVLFSRCRWLTILGQLYPIGFVQLQITYYFEPVVSYWFCLPSTDNSPFWASCNPLVLSSRCRWHVWLRIWHIEVRCLRRNTKRRREVEFCLWTRRHRGSHERASHGRGTGKQVMRDISELTRTGYGKRRVSRYDNENHEWHERTSHD